MNSKVIARVAHKRAAKPHRGFPTVFIPNKPTYNARLRDAQRLGLYGGRRIISL